MKRLIVAALLILSAAKVQAFDLFGDKTSPSFTDNGDTMTPFSVSVGSTTANLIRNTRGTKDRRARVCNPTTAFLYISTFSAANATTSPRTLVQKGGCEDLSPLSNLYGIFEAGQATATVVGFTQWEARD